MSLKVAAVSDNCTEDSLAEAATGSDGGEDDSLAEEAEVVGRAACAAAGAGVGLAAVTTGAGLDTPVLATSLILF